MVLTYRFGLADGAIKWFHIRPAKWFASWKGSSIKIDDPFMGSFLLFPPHFQCQKEKWLFNEFFDLRELLLCSWPVFIYSWVFWWRSGNLKMIGLVQIDCIWIGKIGKRTPASCQKILSNWNKSLGDKGYSQMCSFTGVLIKRPPSIWSIRALDSDRRSGKRANKQRLPTYKLHVMDDIKVLQHVKAWTLSWKI